MSRFRRPLKVRFDDADPRGIMFFGRIFELAHRAFEDFVVSGMGISWDQWFLAEESIVPIKHAEATFFRPLLPGHEYQAEITIAKIGESSFEVVTRMLDGDDAAALCAETRVVHAFASPDRKKMAIPSAIRARLADHLESQ